MQAMMMCSKLAAVAARGMKGFASGPGNARVRMGSAGARESEGRPHACNRDGRCHARGMKWVSLGVAAALSVACDYGDAGRNGEAKPPDAPLQPSGSAGSAGSGATAGTAGVAGAPGDSPLTPGTPVDVEVGGQALKALRSELEEVKSWSAADLVGAYGVSFEPAAVTDLSKLLHYDLLQASRLALTEGESQLLAAQGFVLRRDSNVATFSYGYRTVYAEDLPVFVSADSVLDTVHRSYDAILVDIEQELLAPTLAKFLSAVRANVGRKDVPETVRRDVDFFLAVPQSLLSGGPVAPGFEGSFTPAELADFVEAAEAAGGILTKELFGFKREIDFSQFKPRGHYTKSEALSRYFRAMMWLGRTDLRFLETQDDGTRVLRRQQVEAAFGFRDLIDAEAREQWRLIDRVVTAFVGEHDYMTLPELDGLQQALGIASSAALANVSDEALAQAIIDGKYGEQRIASQVIRADSNIFEPLPLSASFALFGQRYALDSHVFSQVTYSRTPKRVLPDPLDVAFAALGNDHAAKLLEPELTSWSYAPQLAGIRKLADHEPPSAWESSLYTLWLGALRELSAKGAPAGTLAASTLAPSPGAGSGLPRVAKTEPWARRLLNTQLGSWAQLRHDTLLYVKQSYTDGSSCEFPDAYVDPYPEFWARLLRYAERGTELLDGLALEAPALERTAAYFARFAQIVGTLHRMATHQLSGTPHTADDVAFINDAVRISEGGSGPPTIEGWYHQLLYNPLEFGDVDNVVADVHTDVGGPLPVAREPSVLHVGTSYPRLMVVSVDTCAGPRAYVGPVYAFHQFFAPGLTRLNDQEWQLKVDSTPPDEVPWITPVLGP